MTSHSRPGVRRLSDAAVALLLALPLLSPGSGQRSLVPSRVTSFECQAAQKGAEGRIYLSQTNIDTLVQQAFVKLNTAQMIAGTNRTQKDAIEEAKYLIKKLKTMAKDDPNERYVLWKVGELEYQIYLEENDLRATAQNDKQRLINDIVVRYNTEVGKPRPDFVRLKQIEDQARPLDVDKADELEWLTARRSRNVSREVVGGIEAALNKGDFDQARQELDYSLNNKGLLEMSASTYGRLEARLRSLISVDDVKRYLDGDGAKVRSMLSQNNLGEARRITGNMLRRLESVAADVDRGEYARLESRIKQFSATLTHKQDSLLELTVRLFNEQGRAATMDLVEHVLRPAGVEPEKIAELDDALIGIGVSEAAPQATSGGLPENASVAAEGPTVLDELAAKARKKAQQRADSIRAAAAEQARLAKLEYEKEHRREIRREKRLKEKEAKRLARDQERQAKLLAEQQHKSEKEAARAATKRAGQSASQAASADSLDSLLANSPTIRKLNEEKAQGALEQIYVLLEQDRIELAYNRFSEERPFLQKYIIEEAFDMLKTTVEQAFQFAGGK